MVSSQMSTKPQWEHQQLESWSNTSWWKGEMSVSTPPERQWCVTLSPFSYHCFHTMTLGTISSVTAEHNSREAINGKNSLLSQATTVVAPRLPVHSSPLLNTSHQNNNP